MTTEKQRVANQANALLSTGPKTVEGKAIVASNAVKHGIFTKDLIVSSTIGRESSDEYNEVRNNLKECLMPQNQMESLLVEKIAIDFWRLRRVLRYEAGSISSYLETIFRNFYSYGKQKNDTLEGEIRECQEYIEWIGAYVECLEKGSVDFNRPIWEGEDISSNITDDFSLIIQALDNVSYQEKERVRYGVCNYDQLKELLVENGYNDKKKITEKLLEVYENEKQRTEREIVKLEQTIQANIEADKLNTMLGAIPDEENTEKVLKYERSLQKSIYQNLILLKKLQGNF